MSTTLRDLLEVVIRRAYRGYRLDGEASTPPPDWGRSEQVSTSPRGMPTFRYLDRVLVSFSDGTPVLISVRVAALLSSADMSEIERALRDEGVGTTWRLLDEDGYKEARLVTDRNTSLTIGDGEVVACAWK